MMSNTTGDRDGVKQSELHQVQPVVPSGGGAGATGPGGDGGDGGSNEGGGAGGSAGQDAGLAGTLQRGGFGGGGSLAGTGGALGRFFLTGGTVSADISGEVGGAGKNGGTFGGGGGGGGGGVRANAALTISAAVAGGDGGIGGIGSSGTAGSGGGGTGVFFAGPGTITLDQASVVVRGGNSIGNGNGANGGGGVGLYFQGDASSNNTLNNTGLVMGGSSVGGGGGAAVVLARNVTLNNNGGAIAGGDAELAPDGGRGNGGTGILVLGDGNVVNHTGAGSRIEGGGSPDDTVPIPPGIRIEGANNTVITAGQILGGVNLSNKSRANAIEVSGAHNTLELRSGYVFSGKVVCTGSANILALGGSDDVTSFDLSSIGSGGLFSGFAECIKVGISTWTLTGAIGDVPWIIHEGALRLSGARNLYNVTVGWPTAGDNPAASAILDISGVTGSSSTIVFLSVKKNGQIVLGDKTLTLESDGSSTGVISGRGGITILNEGSLDVFGNNTYAGMTTVSGALSLKEGGSISSDVIINQGGGLSLGACTIGGDVTMVGPDSEIGLSEGSATIRGNLIFSSPGNRLFYYYWSTMISSGRPDALMLDVGGNVDLNSYNITVEVDEGAFISGTYGLIQAGGSISGTPVVETLPPNSMVRLNGNRLDLVVS